MSFSQQTLNKVLPAYLYVEYNDDDSVRAFFDAYNELVQHYVNAFNVLNLPIYPPLEIQGVFCDWILTNIYGQPRPVLNSSTSILDGLLGDFDLLGDFLLLGDLRVSVSSMSQTVNDDFYKRIATWNFYRGDGPYFSARWLKRRIMRFLIGYNGTTPNIDQTYAISVTFFPGLICNIVITIAIDGPFTEATATILALAIRSRVCLLPFQLTFNVTIVNEATQLFIDGGFLGVLLGAGYTAAGSLPAGSVYSNNPTGNGLVYIVPGSGPPNPLAPPLYYGLITAAQLQTIGGVDLPWSGWILGSQQLVNPGGNGVIVVA